MHCLVLISLVLPTPQIFEAMRLRDKICTETRARLGLGLGPGNALLFFFLQNVVNIFVFVGLVASECIRLRFHTSRERTPTC